MTKKNICPKCKGRLIEKTYLYMGPYNHIEKSDVTRYGRTQRELWSHAASGVVYKTKKMNIEEFLKHTTGIGVIENKLVCDKCGYSLDNNTANK